MKAYLRALQTRFPALLESKCWVQRRWRLLTRQPFEADFTALRALPPPAPGQVHLDVGANRGQSIDAIRMLRPGATIHSFEPNPILADRLGRMFTRDRGVAINRFGLDDRTGAFDLHVPYYKGFLFDGLASFDPHAAAEWLPRHMPGFQERHQVIRCVRCEVRPLDGLGLDPCFLKIDVQGLEHRVLLGAPETIRRSQPTLLIETPAPATVDLLLSLGYRRCSWDGRRFAVDNDRGTNAFFLSAATLARMPHDARH